MSTVLEQLQYGFDRNSRRTWQRRSLTDTHDQQYSYDALGQVNAAARGSLNLNLTAISGIPASAQSWDYGPTGNWRGYHTAANGTPTLDQHRVHDRGNRLTQIEDNPSNMILDRVGRMRQMAPDAQGDWDGKLEITWDAWSRIKSVKNNGIVVGNYAYDGRHRRVTREVDSETLHSYYNAAWRPVEERKNSETTASISYLWGTRHRDDLVRRDRAVGGTMLNEARYVLMDYFNPAAVTDETGEVKERYAFSAFGVRMILNPDFTVRNSSECGMEFGFQGQFLDGENGLMNYGYRYYSPHLGRWMCKDPIGERGGWNLYCMTSNNPSNSVDHLGLWNPIEGLITEVLDRSLNDGVIWSPAPCRGEGLETRFIQVFWYNQTPNFENGEVDRPGSGYGRLPSKLAVGDPNEPYYPQENVDDLYQDKPSGWFNVYTTFEVCRACYSKCQKCVVTVGPCKSWRRYYGGDLGDSSYPTSPAPSDQWWSTVINKFGEHFCTGID